MQGAGSRSKAGQRPSRRSALWAALREGLFAASPGASLLMLVTAALSWAALFAFATPARISRVSAYFAERNKDTYAFGTGRALALSRVVPDDRPLVLLTGASGVRYAMTRFSRVQADLAERLTVAPSLWNLCTDDQSVLETLAMLEQIPDNCDAILIVGVTPYRFSRGLAWPDHDTERPYAYRLGFRSPIVEYEFASAGHPLDPSIHYLWDNREYYLPRVKLLVGNLWGTPPPEFFPRDNEAGGRHAGPARIAAYKSELQASVLSNYPKRSPVAFEALRRVASELAQRANVTLVLLESPVSPSARANIWGEAFYSSYLSGVADFAAQHDYRHWDLTQDAGLTDDDFYDWTHLNRSEARGRFMTALADRLAALLVETGAASLRD